MNKYLALVVALFFVSAGVSAAALAAVDVTPASITAGATTNYNITINVTTIHDNFTNVTFTFPAGFDISGANASSDTVNMTTGSRTIAGQNITFGGYDPWFILGGENVTILVSNVVNPTATGTYSLTAYTFNSSATDATIDSGTSNTFGIVPAGVTEVRYSYETAAPTAGTAFNGSFTSYDMYGNPVADTYNYSTSDTIGTMPANGTANNTNASLTLRTSGSKTITITSGTNESAANTSTFIVSAATTAYISMFQLATTATAGTAIYGNITTTDVFGNPTSETFNTSTSDSSAVTQADGAATNGTNTFNITFSTSGSQTVTITVATNSSATNSTTVVVSPSTVAYVQYAFSTATPTAGTAFNGSFTSKDKYGNLVADTYNYSTSDTIGTMPANGTSNDTSADFTLRGSGSKTITVSSGSNSSASNASVFTVAAEALISFSISPFDNAIASSASTTYTLIGYDVYGNIQNTSGNDQFNYSVDDGTIAVYDSNTSNTFTFIGGVAGLANITFWSLANLSASNMTSLTVSAGNVQKISISLLSPKAPSGSTFVITVSSFDNAGNAAVSAGNNVSISNSTVLSLSSNTSDTYTFLAGAPGTATLIFYSLSNLSATNTTNATVSAGMIVKVEISPLFPVNQSGRNFSFSVTGRDANGNQNNTGGFIFTQGNESILVLISNTSTTALFRGEQSGNTTFLVVSILNSSAYNLTNASVTVGPVSKILLSPLAPSLTVGGTQLFTATAVDAYGNINSSINNNFTLVVFSATNITGNGSVNSSGFFTSLSAGIVNLLVNYTGTTNSTNVTISAAPTPTATPTTSPGGGSGNPCGKTGCDVEKIPDAIKSEATPTTGPSDGTKPVATELDSNSFVSGTFEESKATINLGFTAGSSGFDGTVEFTLPLDYADFLAGYIAFDPQPAFVGPGSVRVRYDLSGGNKLGPGEEFVGDVIVYKHVEESILQQIQPPKTKLKPQPTKTSGASTVKPTGKSVVGAAYNPSASEGIWSYIGWIILVIALLIVGAYLYSMRMGEKTGKH
ncbi:MAG: hypothetical protein ABH863_00525 [Candidatus Micrarchaeota archaeon]